MHRVYQISLGIVVYREVGSLKNLIHIHKKLLHINKLINKGF